MLPTRRWLPVALLVALLGGWALVSVQQRLDLELGDYRSEEQLLYLSSPAWVKRLSLGYDGLLACIYWTRAVQHYGREHLAHSGSYPLLYPLLDITTTLDPEMLLAYRFGAIFLTEEPPAGPGQPELAIQLLEKGIRANPDYWRLWYDLGFVYYRSLKDYPKASWAFAQGAKNPQARPWMRVMAAQVAAEGGNRRLSMALWREVYESTDDPIIRQNALRHLAGLKVDADVEALRALFARYEKQTGQPPRSWQDLISAGYLRGVPADPTGLPYILAPDGRVYLHPDSPVTTAALARKR